MKEIREGYKILRPDLTSPFSPIKVHYSKEWTTPPSWLHGPLSVFHNYDDAKSFAWSDDPDKYHIWEVEYVQETTDRLRALWYPEKESDGSIIPHINPFTNYPCGTDFARAVRLIQRITSTQSFLSLIWAC